MPCSTYARAIEHLCDECRAHFNLLRELLDTLGVNHVIDHRLVRGLDYYTRTSFEYYVAGREGQQEAIGGGGRYDGLVELLGGRPTPGIGFGIGLDRTILALEEQRIVTADSEPLVAIISSEPDFARRLEVAARLRGAGLAVRPDGSTRKLGRQLESAAKAGARWAVILGGDGVVLRDLAGGEQRQISVDELPGALLQSG